MEQINSGGKINKHIERRTLTHNLQGVTCTADTRGSITFIRLVNYSSFK